MFSSVAFMTCFTFRMNSGLLTSFIRKVLSIPPELGSFFQCGCGFAHRAPTSDASTLHFPQRLAERPTQVDSFPTFGKYLVESHHTFENVFSRSACT